MPFDKPEDNTPTDPKKSIPDAQIPTAEVKPQDGGKERIGSEQPENGEKRKVKPRTINITHIPKIDVIEGIEANSIAKKANGISLSSVIVNGLLLLATIVIVVISKCQYKTTIDVLKFQRQTQKTADSTRRISDSLQKIKDSVSLNIQDSSLNAQIAALKETQAEFEIETRPFIQITDIKIEQPKQNISGSFNINNSGKQPGRIITAEVKIALADSNNYKNKLKSIPSTANGVFIPNAAPFKFTFEFQGLNDVEISNLQSRKAFFYMTTVIIYKSQSSKKIYKSTFFYRIHIYPELGIEIDKEWYK